MADFDDFTEPEVERIPVDRDSIIDYRTEKDWTYQVDMTLRKHNGMIMIAIGLGAVGTVGSLFSLRTLAKLTEALKPLIGAMNAQPTPGVPVPPTVVGPPPGKEPGSYTGVSKGASAGEPGTNTGRNGGAPLGPQGSVAEPVVLDDAPIIPVGPDQEPLL